MSVDLKGNTNFVVLKNLQDELIVPRTNLAAVDMVVANGLSVAGSTLSITMATTEDIELGTSGSIVTPDALKPILDSKQTALEAGTGVELVAGETASTISVSITDVETLIDGTTATKVVDVAALRGALTTGQAVDVTSAPDGVTGDYLGSFTVTGSSLGFAAFPKYAKNLNYLFIATIVPTTAGTVTPSANCKWLDTGDRAAKSVAAGVSVKLAVTFTSSANTCPASFALSGTGSVTVSYCRQYEVTACTTEAIAYIASLSNPDAFADYYLVKADMVQPWTYIIDMGTSPAVTIESNHSYKLLATGTHQLSVGTCPSGYTGQDALITIIVGVAGTVQTVAPLKTSATFTSASINDCVVKFRDGKAFLLVENTEEAYVVSVTSGTEEGSLPYGLANNASVIMFAPATSGQSIALSDVTATISDGVSLSGNGTASTLLAGGDLTCSGELRAFELTFTEVNIYDSVLTCSNVLLSQEVRFYSCVINNASVNGSVVLEGGVANNFKIMQGELDVNGEDGSATNTTVNSGGSMFISREGSATNTTVNSGGSMEIDASASATNTTVNQGGSMFIGGEGSATNTTVNSGGSMFISEDGSATHITVNQGGNLLGDWGSASEVMENGGCVGGDWYDIFFAPNTFSGLELKYPDSATVHSGTTANNTTLVNNGILYVYFGGTANSTTASADGILYVNFGGTANSTTLNSYGNLFVSSGGTVNNTTVNAGGRLHVISGGTVNNTTVNSNGYLSVSSGCIANNVTVNENGYLEVSSGGTATNIVWTPCEGHVYVSDGGYATFANTYTGVYYGDGHSLLSSAASMDGKTLSSAYEMHVFSDGTAINTTVNSGGNLWVSGTATTTTVNSGGKMHVSSGGTATDVMENGGYVEILDGATVTFVSNTFSGLELKYPNSATVHSGTTANNTTIDAGELYVYFGGTANSTTVTNAVGNLIVSSGGTATDVMLKGSMYVFNGGTGNAVRVDRPGHLEVKGSGTATNATVNSGGWLDVKSGGTVNNTTVNSNGYLSVSSGCIANNVTVNENGSLEVSSGGTATGITAAEGAYLGFVVAPDTYIAGASAGSAFEIKDGSVANYAINYGCALHVSSGGTANSATVNSGGNLIVSSGTANRITVNSDGKMNVARGGTANSVTVNSGGSLTVSRGGGIANEPIISSGGSLIVSSGASALLVTSETGAVITSKTGAYITYK